MIKNREQEIDGYEYFSL